MLRLNRGPFCDVVGLAILNPARFFVDITGDEHDNPASPLEGQNDKLALAGVLDPASVIIKFERRLAVVAADAATPLSSQGFELDPTTFTDETGVDYLSEPAGSDDQADATVPEGTVTHRLFLPVVAVNATLASPTVSDEQANMPAALSVPITVTAGITVTP